MLRSDQIEDFVRDGFVRIDHAFPSELAEQGRAILWTDTGCDPNDQSTWKKPVIRLNDYPQEPFRLAVNQPCLLEAFDQLVGAGRWLPRTRLGTFPIRFPHSDEAGDTGWHAEASFAGGDGSWRLNVNSRGARVADAVLVFGCRGSRCADANSGWVAHGRSAPARALEGVQQIV